MSTENIDIRVREDGSRVVARSLDQIAEKSENAGKFVDKMNRSLGDTSKVTTSLDRLKTALQGTEISLQKAFSSTEVERFGRNLSQYRQNLMRYFEDVSRGARASSAAIKSQMEAMTAKPVGLEQMSAYYRNLEAEQAAFINNAVSNITKQQTAETRANAERLQSAMTTITQKQAREEAYTSWWLGELKKRQAAEAASAMKTAEQRSGMQAFNSARLNRSLIAPEAGTSDMAKFYAAQQERNVGGKTSLETTQMQALQRQMAMYQLFLPMLEKELAIENEGIQAKARHAAAINNVTSGKSKLASSTKESTERQRLWNEQAKEAHALARGLSGSLGTLWMTYGSILPLLTGAALGSAFLGAAKSGAELTYQLQFVQSLGNESSEAIGKLAAQADQLSRTGPYGAKEIASGYRMLAQAGKDANESLQIMPDVLNLATVGELNMEQAGLAVVGTLNAFKLGIEDAGRVSDLFAKAAAVSQSSVQDLTQSMRYASTTATMYKQDVTDTMTALALLAKVNITGTSAGTAYRNMLKEIYTPTKQATQIWQQLGIETTKVVNGHREMKSFVDVMYDLKSVTDKYDEPSKAKIIAYLFGERGSKEAAEMLDMTKSKWEEFRASIENSQGFSKKVADDLNQTAKIQWKQALNTLEAELEASFKRMEPQYANFAKQLKEVFESEGFRSGVDTIIQITLTLAQAFLDLAPVIINVAKAWLVLKAAQGGMALAQLLAATATATQALAAGMLAASGAMGPVAVGMSRFAPLLAALGGPLSVILGLLTAGAAAWAIWGSNAESASKKATRTTEQRLKELRNEQIYGDGELGKAREELATRENRLKLMLEHSAYSNVGNKNTESLREAREAVNVQQQLVDMLEQRETKIKNLGKTEVKNVVNNSKLLSWQPPEKTKVGVDYQLDKSEIRNIESQMNNEISLLQSKNHNKLISEEQYRVQLEEIYKKYDPKLEAEYQSSLDHLADIMKRSQGNELKQAETAYNNMLTAQQTFLANKKLRIQKSIDEEEGLIKKSWTDVKKFIAEQQTAVDELMMKSQEFRLKLQMSPQEQASYDAGKQIDHIFGKRIADQNVVINDALASGAGPDNKVLQAAYSQLNQLYTIREKLKEQAQRNAVDEVNYARSFEAGAHSAFQSYLDKATNAAEQTREIFSKCFNGMEDALVEFARTGKLNFREFTISIIADIIRIQTRALMAQTVSQSSGYLGLIGGMVGAMFSGGGSAVGAATGSVVANTADTYSIPISSASVTATTLPSAKGNVFSSSGLHKYVNTIQTTPQYFGFDQLHAFAKGGVFAEAGPEAVMPLTRDASGRLGVTSVGGGGESSNVEITQNFYITVEGSDTGDGTNVANDVATKLIPMVKQQTMEVITEQMRPGGVLASQRG